MNFTTRLVSKLSEKMKFSDDVKILKSKFSLHIHFYTHIHLHIHLYNFTGFAPNPTEPERNNDSTCSHELSTETSLLSDCTPDSTNPVHEPCDPVYDYTNPALDFTTEGSCSTTFDNSFYGHNLLMMK